MALQFSAGLEPLQLGVRVGVLWLQYLPWQGKCYSAHAQEYSPGEKKVIYSEIPQLNLELRARIMLNVLNRLTKRVRGFLLSKRLYAHTAQALPEAEGGPKGSPPPPN